MNILYLCADPGIPIRGHKGAAVHVRSLADAFSALGHKVTLLTPRPGPADGPPPGARIIEVSALQPPVIAVPAEAREQLILDTADAVYDVARELLAKEPFDLIYERYSLWSDVGARLAHESNVPLIVEVNAPLRAEAARYRSLYHADRAAAIEARLLSAAKAVAVVSTPLREYVIAQGVPADRVHVLPNAVDERLFHPAMDGAALRARLGLTDKFVVGFVGTVKPWHDLDTLFVAVSRLQSDQIAACHLLLVGNIPESVRASIARLGLAEATTIVEPIPHADVPPFIAAMDVAVSPHPSLAGFYFSPLKLFEYLACGVAAVAADVPPIAEVIADGVTGLLYPPGDAVALAERIATLAATPSLRTQLGWQGAAYALQHHTWQGNARQIIGWLVPASVNGQFSVMGDGTGVGARLPLFDDRLRRRLFRATRADMAGPLLAPHLPNVNGRTCDRIVHLEVLKYKPHRRCVIAYELATAEPQGPSWGVIGKVFRDERGAQLFALQQSLWGDGFGLDAADHITVPKPLAYIPEMGMLAQEHAPGQPLDEFLGSLDFISRVRQSAVAIAKLHNCRVRPVVEYTLKAELDNLDRWAAELAAWRPDHAPAFGQQLASLRGRALALPPSELVPAHRDFYYSQVLFTNARAVLIDLDMLALADPAIDVANFAAHLRFLAIQRLADPHRLDADATLFVEEYTRQRRPSPEFLPRLAFYEAATFFRLMHVVLQRPRLTYCFDRLFEICAAGFLAGDWTSSLIKHQL